MERRWRGLRETIETTDIFRGAFFLCMGKYLKEIRFKKDRKNIAFFEFSGQGLNRLDNDYMAGKALVNPVQLRESLNWLRDTMFKRLRELEGRYRYERNNRRGISIPR
jgi:hypothetical protein